MEMSSGDLLRAMRSTEFGPEILPQWIEPEFFERSVGLFGLIVLASTCAHPDKLPVGGPITGAPESLRINERLQQVNRMMIESLPVLGDKLGHFAQQMAAQSGNHDPR